MTDTEVMQALLNGRLADGSLIGDHRVRILLTLHQCGEIRSGRDLARRLGIGKNNTADFLAACQSLGLVVKTNSTFHLADTLPASFATNAVAQAPAHPRPSTSVVQQRIEAELERHDSDEPPRNGAPPPDDADDMIRAALVVLAKSSHASVRAITSDQLARLVGQFPQHNLALCALSFVDYLERGGPKKNRKTYLDELAKDAYPRFFNHVQNCDPLTGQFSPKPRRHAAPSTYQPALAKPAATDPRAVVHWESLTAELRAYWKEQAQSSNAVAGLPDLTEPTLTNRARALAWQRQKQ